jgi:hypothetical protein
MRREPAIRTTLAALLIPLAGCAVLLPAHENSHDFEGEQVQVRMLTHAEMTQHQARYDAAFAGITTLAAAANWPSGLPVVYELRTHDGDLVASAGTLEEVAGALNRAAALPALAAPLAGMAVDFAVDFVRRQLDEEATRYEAQFEGQAFVDRFWNREEQRIALDRSIHLQRVLDDAIQSKGLVLTRVALRQHYYGFEIVRTTQRRSGDTPAFRLVYGIAPATDHQVFLLGPLLLDRKSAKAKVLSARAWTYFPIPYGWALEASDEVDTHVNVEIAAIWRERQAGGFDQRFHTEKLVSFSFDAPNQNLDAPIPLEVASGLPRSIGGWFGSVPISFDALNRPVGHGTAVVRVLVTEKDASNARKRLEQASDQIEAQREPLRERVSQAVQDLPH